MQAVIGPSAFSPTRKLGQSVIVPVMPMTIPTAIIWLPGIAALVIGLRPGGVAIAWRMTIIRAVAVAVGATAEDQGNEQHTQNSRQLFHTGDSYR